MSVTTAIPVSKYWELAWSVGAEPAIRQLQKDIGSTAELKIKTDKTGYTSVSIPDVETSLDAGWSRLIISGPAREIAIQGLLEKVTEPGFRETSMTLRIGGSRKVKVTENHFHL